MCVMDAPAISDAWKELVILNALERVRTDPWSSPKKSESLPVANAVTSVWTESAHSAADRKLYPRRIHRTLLRRREQELARR